MTPVPTTARTCSKLGAVLTSLSSSRSPSPSSSDTRCSSSSSTRPARSACWMKPGARRLRAGPHWPRGEVPGSGRQHGPRGTVCRTRARGRAAGVARAAGCLGHTGNCAPTPQGTRRERLNAFLLAERGLDGLRATTHWGSIAWMREHYTTAREVRPHSSSSSSLPEYLASTNSRAS
jgi:hypothetical protein